MRNAYLFICICCWAVNLSGQQFPLLRWQKFYDNVGDDIPKRLLKAPDGHLVIGGTTYMQDSTGEQCSNAWIIKVDTLGDLVWEQEIGMKGCEELRDLIPVADGGYVFVGVTTSLIDHNETGDPTFGGDYLVGKLTETGQIEWVNSYGGSRLDQAFGVVEGIYREYLITGSSRSADGAVGQNTGRSDMWLFKVDTRGQRRFSKAWGGQRDDWGQAIARCQNGDYLIAGMTQSPELGSSPLGRYGNGLLLRMTQQGVIIWSRTFPDHGGACLNRVLEQADGSILVSGSTRANKGDTDFWWALLSKDGTVQHQNRLPGPHQEVLTGQASWEEGFLFGGYSLPFSGQKGPYHKGGEDFWLWRTDRQGQMVWRKTFGGPDAERCRDVLRYSPGVFYAVGEKLNRFTRTTARHDKDFWLLRVDEFPEDSLQASIFVRATDMRINRETPTRFRAVHTHGERFLWDFGDGTTSTEEQPLKTYTLSGTYDVRLTVFTNENCTFTVEMAQPLEVW